MGIGDDVHERRGMCSTWCQPGAYAPVSMIAVSGKDNQNLAIIQQGVILDADHFQDSR